MRQLPSTIELVNFLQNETNEVKTSIGGTHNFRSVIDFVLSSSEYQDNDKGEVVKRGKKKIAAMLEERFAADVLNDVKSIYSKVVIENGFDLAAQNFYNKL